MRALGRDQVRSLAAPALAALVAGAIAWCSPAFASLPPASFDFDPVRSPLPPALHQRVVEVMDHIYSFQFDAAVAKARDIHAADPGHPLGDFLLAEAYWWQAVNNRDRPELGARFREHIEAAIASSERRLERDERDPLALFFIGNGHGRKAILDGMDGRRFESVNTSVKARKYLKLLNEHHPELEDAYCGLGIYDYFAAQLPWFARILSKLLLGLGGDRERGIAELERAARYGLFTQVEARVFLAIAYIDTEGRYEEALDILKQLNNRYPGNLDCYGMLAFAYRTRYDYANAIHMLETLVERSEHEPAFGRQSRMMSAYFLASTYKLAGLHEQALSVLDRLLADVDPKTEWMTVSSLLERGRVYDTLGNRAAAVADYRRVLELRDFRNSRNKAKKYLAEPYQVSEEERSHHLITNGSRTAPAAGGAPARGDNERDLAGPNAPRRRPTTP